MSSRSFLAESAIAFRIGGLDVPAQPRAGRPVFDPRLVEDYDVENYDDAAADANRRVSKAALFCGGKLCMGIRNDNGKWTIPGGHADDGEDPLAAVVREVYEETGIELQQSDFVPLGHRMVERDDGEKILVSAYRAEVPDVMTDTGEDPDSEVTRWNWIDVANGLPDEILQNAHVPPESDVTMQALGLAPESAPVPEEAWEHKPAMSLGGMIPRGDLKLYGEAEEPPTPPKDDEVEEDVAQAVAATKAIPDARAAGTRPPSFTGASKRVFKGMEAMREKAKGLKEVEQAVDSMDKAYWDVQRAIMRCGQKNRGESRDVELMIGGMLEELTEQQAMSTEVVKTRHTRRIVESATSDLLRLADMLSNDESSSDSELAMVARQNLSLEPGGIAAAIKGERDTFLSSKPRSDDEAIQILARYFGGVDSDGGAETDRSDEIKAYAIRYHERLVGSVEKDGKRYYIVTSKGQDGEGFMVVFYSARGRQYSGLSGPIYRMGPYENRKQAEGEGVKVAIAQRRRLGEARDAE